MACSTRGGLAHQNDLAWGKLKTVDVIQEYILCLHFMFLHITFSGIQVRWVRHELERWYYPSAQNLLKYSAWCTKNMNATGNFVQVMLSGRIITVSVEYFGGKSNIFWCWAMLTHSPSEAKKQVQFNKIFRERIYQHCSPKWQTSKVKVCIKHRRCRGVCQAIFFLLLVFKAGNEWTTLLQHWLANFAVTILSVSVTKAYTAGGIVLFHQHSQMA